MAFYSLLHITSVFLSFSGFGLTDSQFFLSGNVVDVRSANVFEILLSRSDKKVKVKLKGIGCPVTTPLKNQAKNYLWEYIIYRDVVVEQIELVNGVFQAGKVFVEFDEEWFDVSMEMVGSGWCWSLNHQDREIQIAENNAKRLKKGVWKHAKKSEL